MPQAVRNKEQDYRQKNFFHVLTSESDFAQKNTRTVAPLHGDLIVEPNFAIGQRDCNGRAGVSENRRRGEFFDDKTFGLSLRGGAERAQIVQALFDANANGAVVARAVVIRLRRNVRNRKNQDA